MECKKEDIQYIDRSIPKLDEEQIEKVLKHCNRYKIFPDIDRYYDDWEEYLRSYQEWGYTEKEAYDKLHAYYGEFLIFSDWGILRFDTHGLDTKNYKRK